SSWRWPPAACRRQRVAGGGGGAPDTQGLSGSRGGHSPRACVQSRSAAAPGLPQPSCGSPGAGSNQAQPAQRTRLPPLRGVCTRTLALPAIPLRPPGGLAPCGLAALWRVEERNLVLTSVGNHDRLQILGAKDPEGPSRRSLVYVSEAPAPEVGEEVEGVAWWRRGE